MAYIFVTKDNYSCFAQISSHCKGFLSYQYYFWSFDLSLSVFLNSVEYDCRIESSNNVNTVFCLAFLILLSHHGDRQPGNLKVSKAFVLQGLRAAELLYKLRSTSELLLYSLHSSVAQESGTCFTRSARVMFPPPTQIKKKEGGAHQTMS